jgi:hypothetical protein
MTMIHRTFMCGIKDSVHVRSSRTVKWLMDACPLQWLG